MRYDVSGLSRGAELHDMLKAEVMLRRLKRDVLSQVRTVAGPGAPGPARKLGACRGQPGDALLQAVWLLASCSGARCLPLPAPSRALPLPAPPLHPQLPPKRRQVIRLPKPPASEWPKAPKGAKRRATAAAADSGSEGEEEEEEDGGDSEGEGGEDEGEGEGGGEPKLMSAAHRTGLAKASSVIDWLMTALGVRGGRGGRRQVGSREGERLVLVP